MKKIVIVGCGVVGACSAYYFNKKGFDVSIIEKEKDDFQNCSYVNAGFITPSHFIPLASKGMAWKGFKWMFNSESPFYIKPRFDTELFDWCVKFYKASKSDYLKKISPFLCRFNLESRKCYEEISHLLENNFELTKNGILLLCQSQKTLDDEIKIAELGRKFGLIINILSKTDTEKLEPNINMNITGAVHYLDDFHLNPSSFMKNLKNYLIKNGVKIFFNEEVTEFNFNGDRIKYIITKNKKIEADEYIICSGSASSLLLKKLKVYLPMQSGKGYSLTIENPKQNFKIPCILVERRVAVTPFKNSLRFGGTMEITNHNNKINQNRINGIIKSVNKYFPNFNFEDVPVGFGFRPCTPDGLPYLGRMNDFKNLSVAFGHAMMGMSLGPITGEIISEIILDRKTLFELDLLNPSRFSN